MSISSPALSGQASLRDRALRAREERLSQERRSYIGRRNSELRALLQSVAGITDAAIEADGIAHIDAITFTVQEQTSDSGLTTFWTLHIVDRCPTCGVRGPGPKIATLDEIGDQLVAFRLADHVCPEVAK